MKLCVDEDDDGAWSRYMLVVSPSIFRESYVWCYVRWWIVAWIMAAWHVEVTNPHASVSIQHRPSGTK